MTRCHRCGTTEPARFYRGNNKAWCKACRRDWARTATGRQVTRQANRRYRWRNAGRVWLGLGNRTYRVTLLPGLGHVRLWGIRDQGSRREGFKWWEYRYRP